jgi:ubiquinone/menaquinone biosynthesis C-methylase UbiE
MTDQPREAAEYALGYSEREKERLIIQSRLYGELTERLFRMAGIQPGMSVLDVGCGVGDVSLLAATIVGPAGSALGVDRAADSIDTARRRARAAGLENIAFEVAALQNLDPGRTFDALVGRLVLMYLPDPAATLAHLLTFVRPGGLVVFQEMEMSLARTRPPVRLYQTCLDVILETFRRAGFEIDMGSRLYSTYLQAGLPRPELRMEGRVEGGAGSAAYELTAETVRSLLPMMERLGVATSSEFEVDTLAARMEAETCAGGGVIMPPPMIGAWARKLG